jgi:hypothetical protein
MRQDFPNPLAEMPARAPSGQLTEVDLPLCRQSSRTSLASNSFVSARSRCRMRRIKNPTARQAGATSSSSSPPLRRPRWAGSQLAGQRQTALCRRPSTAWRIETAAQDRERSTRKRVQRARRRPSGRHRDGPQRAGLVGKPHSARPSHESQPLLQGSHHQRPRDVTVSRRVAEVSMTTTTRHSWSASQTDPQSRLEFRSMQQLKPSPS